MTAISTEGYLCNFTADDFAVFTGSGPDPDAPDESSITGVSPDTYALVDGATITVTGVGLSETTRTMATGYPGTITPDSVSDSTVVLTIPAQASGGTPGSGLVVLQRDDMSTVASCDAACLTAT